MPTPLVVALDGPIARAELPRLCAHVRAGLESTARASVECDVCAAAPDAVTVDAIARLVLLARRHGQPFRLHGVSEELLDLIELMGLRAALTGEG